MFILPTNRPVLFFDGVCNLCNATVNFIIKRDHRKLFLFAPFQSTAGLEALTQAHAGKTNIPETVVLYYKGNYYMKADAVLQTAKILGGWCKLLLAGYILPRFLRNALYNLIASRRYKWFGKQEHCMMPGVEIKSRFLVE